MGINGTRALPIKVVAGEGQEGVPRCSPVALLLGNCEFTDGLTITIRRSKTDQEGEGRKIGIPKGSNLETCPVHCFGTSGG